MTDFLDAKVTEIDDRMKELKPLVDEFRRLEAAKTALDGVTVPAAASNGGSTPKAPRAPRARKSTGAKRGRPKGSGTRGAEALEIIRENPGIKIPEIAEKMGIKQNYLYRVVPSIAEEGLVRKVGEGWEAVAQSAVA